MDNTSQQKQLKGIHVLWMFIAFFALVFAVNTIFITVALDSKPGLVIEDAYKKGINYNETLEYSRNQPNYKHKITVKNNKFYWQLNDEFGTPIEGAEIKVAFKRLVNDKADIFSSLDALGNGLYVTDLEQLPYKGQWMAQLNATWKNKTFKKNHLFILK